MTDHYDLTITAEEAEFLDHLLDANPFMQKLLDRVRAASRRKPDVILIWRRVDGTVHTETSLLGNILLTEAVAEGERIRVNHTAFSPDEAWVQSDEMETLIERTNVYIEDTQ